MFRNFFKTAFRNMSRHRSTTLINIAGLAVGIGVCMIIFMVIQFHRSYENFHPDKDRIYRVLTEYHHADAPDAFYGRGVPFPMPQGLKVAFPQLKQVAAVLADYNDQILVMNEQGEAVRKFKEEQGVFVTEPSFFNIFHFPLLTGSYTSLKDPGNALLVKETAEKYFGDWKKAIGRTIRINNTDVVKVSGVLASIPANTDFQLKIVVAMGTGATREIMTSTDWDGTRSNYGCFILLPPHASVDAFNRQLRAYSRKMESPQNKDSHIVQPLSDVHYDTQAGGFSNKTISRELIRVLWMIAAFILLIACVNFINLSTAHAVNRSKEIGVRKVMGSTNSHIQYQFLIETFLIVLVSIILAVLLSWIASPAVSKLMNLDLNIHFLQQPTIFIFLLTLALGVTCLAGFYPSLVLSRYNVIHALKNQVAARSTKGVSLRRGLVVFQFVIAQALIIGTLIIVKQLNYFTSQPLGFDKEAVINAPIPTDSVGLSKLDYLKKQLAGINGIEKVSFSSNTPIEDNNDSWTTFIFNHAVKETDFFSIVKLADQDYVPTYRLPLVTGRNINASDTLKELLVNESVVKSLGIKNPEDVLNKEVAFPGSGKATIVGVLKDFNNRSFRADKAPMIITSFKKGYSEAGIKISLQNITATIKKMESLWNQVFPDFVFEYKFLDDKVAEFYKQEMQLSLIYKVFASIAIFLSCLGLFGLASFLAVQRIKEVGIRKVLGASVSSIVYLFSKEFMVLITIAFLIATPVAWSYMHHWLNDYTYRISLSWWIFIAGGLLSLVIALLTISFQAIKAALSNPVKSLRTE